MGEGRLVFVEFAGVETGLGDDALAVNQRDVAHGNPDGDVVVRTGNGRCACANDHDLEVGQHLALEFSSVEQCGSGDDGRPVLVVMHDGNVGGLGNAALDFEALGRLDVFEVDAAKGLGDVDHGVDEFLRVFGVHLNVEHVDAGEGLQEQALAFHDRLAG